MGFNRIDWSRVPGARAAHRSVVMQVGFDHEVTFQDCRVDVAEFLDRVIESLGLPPEEKVVFLGDGADTALWLPVAVLREHFSSLFQAPQHYYVHPPDAGWCLNYTFEDDLYFGHAVWQEGRKPRRVR